MLIAMSAPEWARWPTGGPRFVTLRACRLLRLERRREGAAEKEGGQTLPPLARAEKKDVPLGCRALSAKRHAF